MRGPPCRSVLHAALSHSRARSLSLPRRPRSPDRRATRQRRTASSAEPAPTAPRGTRTQGTRRRGVAHGIRATITPTAAANVVAGHVAGWVGVGGPGQGANGQTMWLQVGVASIPDTPTMVYAEITRGGQDPVFVPLLQDVKVGESHKVAVLEISGRSNWWRVWLDGKSRHGAGAARELDEPLEADRDGRVVERRPARLQPVRLPLRRCRRRRLDRRLVAPVQLRASSSRIAASASSA